MKYLKQNPWVASVFCSLVFIWVYFCVIMYSWRRQVFFDGYQRGHAHALQKTFPPLARHVGGTVWNRKEYLDTNEHGEIWHVEERTDGSVFMHFIYNTNEVRRFPEAARDGAP